MPTELRVHRVPRSCTVSMRLPRPLRRPRRPAISAEPWPSSHRRHCAARDHWAHAPVCPSVSAPFLRPRLLSPIACALPRRHSRLAVPVSSRSRIIVGVVPLGPCPYRAHPAAPPSASAPRPSCRAPHPHCAHRTPPASPSLALRRQRGPGWQESRRMHPFFAECAKKAPSLAISARNACFSRSKWQDPRLMRPFPGAIGRFGMHGARILPSRPPFRVEGPEIIHGAKMLPVLPDLSRHRGAGRGPANWPNGLCALRPGPGPLAACAGLCYLVRPAATRARGPPRGLRCGSRNSREIVR